MPVHLLRPRVALYSIRLSPKAYHPVSVPSCHPTRSHRHASTSAADGAAQSGRFRAVLYGTAVAASLYATYIYATDTRASFHRWLVPPLMRLIFSDAEDAHHYGTTTFKALHNLNLHPRERGHVAHDTGLSASIFNTNICNPVGISAGLDKDAEIPDALFALGAGVVEVGGCTPLPQAGNPKPRVFRVPMLDGMINRYGLNSRGADDMARRLRDRLRRFAKSIGLSESEVLNGEANVPAGSLHHGRLLAVQIAKNKETDERDEKAVARDYVYCVQRLAPYADILVVNVSSPNTPGLRDLQATKPLTRLLSAVVKEAAKTDRKQAPRVMVKVSPDEDEDTDLEGIVQAVRLSGIDGIIVGNTTKRRDVVPPGVALTAKENAALGEQGGYSGPAMFDRTLNLVARYRQMLDSGAMRSQAGAKDGHEQKVIFATGGITNGEQALQVLNAGASVAMVYTGLVYGGVGTISRIKQEMRTGMQQDRELQAQ